MVTHDEENKTCWKCRIKRPLKKLYYDAQYCACLYIIRNHKTPEEANEMLEAYAMEKDYASEVFTKCRRCKTPLIINVRPTPIVEYRELKYDIREQQTE